MSPGQTILVVAAHADDEALGCGGSMARWAGEGRSVHPLLLADGEGARGDAADPALSNKIEKRRAATEAAAKILGVATVTMLSFADNRMDGVELLDIVKAIEARIHAVRPDTVLTHHAGDVNVDHEVDIDARVAQGIRLR